MSVVYILHSHINVIKLSSISTCQCRVRCLPTTLTLSKQNTNTYRFNLPKLLPILQKPLHHLRSRMMHPHSPIHKLHPTFLTHLHNLIKLLHTHRHRLLQQNMLPFLRRSHRPLHMQRRRQRHVNSVNIRVVKNFFVRAVDFGGGREIVEFGEGCCFGESAAADGGDCGGGREENGA